MLRGAESDRAKVSAGLVETWAVCTATVFRILELNRIVFPPADFTNEPRPRRLFIQGEVATARARVPVHIDIVGHRKEIFCDLTSATSTGRTPGSKIHCTGAWPCSETGGSIWYPRFRSSRIIFQVRSCFDRLLSPEPRSSYRTPSCRISQIRRHCR
jgi:hypothetical protein